MLISYEMVSNAHEHQLNVFLLTTCLMSGCREVLPEESVLVKKTAHDQSIDGK